MEQEQKSIESIPQHIQKEANAFLASIKNVDFFKHDNAPKKEWKLFYGEDWSKAFDAARNAIAKEMLMETASIIKRQEEDPNAKPGVIHMPNTSRAVAERTVAHALNEVGIGDAAGALDAKVIKATLAQVSKALKNEKIELPKEVATYASLDFALNAAYIMAGDKIPKDDANRKNAEAFLEVWKKGYALFCDYNGTLYVYAPAPKSLLEARR